MPFTLAPLSRRRFLAQTASATAALLLGKSLSAAERKSNPARWALLSDPHIAADRALIARETNMTDNLVAVAKEVNAIGERPAAVLVNGDCAYNVGEKADYATFTSLFQPLREAGLPIHVTLGNHDHRANIRESFKEAQGDQPVPDKLVGIIRSEHANWFLLDSLEIVNKTPGLLGEAQLAWLEKSLDAHADKPAIIFAHHNLNLTTAEAKSQLKDTEKLLAALTPRKHVKAYIFGHTHTWDTQQHASGLHLINLPPVGYVFDKKRPNGWVDALLRKDGIRLELMSLNRQHADHGQVKDLKWRTA